MLRDAVHEHPPLLVRGEVDAALQHTAAMAVRRDLQRVSSGCIVHKLGLLGAQTLQAALDDVVAVEVAYQGHHAALKSLCGQVHLRCASVLSMLECSSAICVRGSQLALSVQSACTASCVPGLQSEAGLVSNKHEPEASAGLPEAAQCADSRCAETS